MKQTHRLCISLVAFSLLVACNFHEVDEQSGFYRSGQFSKKELQEYITTYGIKTVINLRGEAKGKGWWEDEVAVSKEMGVEHVDIAMNAGRLPHRTHLLQLIDAFENAPRPILIHCWKGGDRTGEAAAMWVMDIMGKSKQEALKQLDKKYYYYAFLAPAKKYFIQEIYQGKDWAKTSYDPCTQDYKHYDKKKYCNPTAQILIQKNLWSEEEDKEYENP